MTTLICWSACASDECTAVYIGSDSRFSHLDEGGALVAAVDTGQKVFVSKSTPDILGFAGDVNFFQSEIKKLVSSLEQGALVLNETCGPARGGAVYEWFRDALSRTPTPPSYDSYVFYATRIGKEDSCRFHVFIIEWKDGWLSPLVEAEIPTKQSCLLASAGTGVNSYDSFIRELRKKTETLEDYRDQAKKNRCLSRYIYMSLVDSISSLKDDKSAGAPQLAGINRRYDAQHYGIISAGTRFFMGNEYKTHHNTRKKMWVNDRFEICSWRTMRKRKWAPSQPHPIRGLK